MVSLGHAWYPSNPDAVLSATAGASLAAIALGIGLFRAARKDKARATDRVDALVGFQTEGLILVGKLMEEEDPEGVDALFDEVAKWTASVMGWLSDRLPVFLPLFANTSAQGLAYEGMNVRVNTVVQSVEAKIQALSEIIAAVRARD